MKRVSRIIAIALAIVCLTATAINLGAANAIEQADWTARLEALDPAKPIDYFLLAEEVADVIADDEDKALARRLFRLAAALSPEQFGRSSCIALADLADDEQQRRRYAALASLLSPGGGIRSTGSLLENSQRWLEPEELTVLALGEALSFYRRGSSARISGRLERGDAVPLVRSLEPVLSSRTVDQLLNSPPSPRHRPQLSDGQIVQMLRVEDALLSGRSRSWSSDLALTRGNPLIEVDPSRLQHALGLTTRQTRYRNGQWVQ